MPDGKRMKLLTTKRTSEPLKSIYEKNATESPLLRCPPEVRNRIWYFALCGKTIHVSGYKHIRHAICRADTQDGEADIGARATETYTKRHAGCINEDGRPRRQSARQHKLPFALFRSCRQVHQEAALLPYKHNIFTFIDLSAIEYFLKILILAQARAIEKIHIVQTIANYRYVGVAYSKLLRSKLKGLKELSVQVEVEDGPVPPIQTVQAIHLARVRDTLVRRLRFSLMHFQHLPAVSANVTISVVHNRVQSLPGAELTAARTDQIYIWAKQLEEEIMQPADDD